MGLLVMETRTIVDYRLLNSGRDNDTRWRPSARANTDGCIGPISLNALASGQFLYDAMSVLQSLRTSEPRSTTCHGNGEPRPHCTSKRKVVVRARESKVIRPQKASWTD